MTNANARGDFQTRLKCIYRTKEEVLGRLKKSPVQWHRYNGMNKEWRQYFLDFCVGKRTLPLLYDVTFKRIFHTDVHPERLSDLISCILGVKVRVREILPKEDILIDGGKMVVMDILVQLEDGSLANVEIQKQPYLFPGERMSCYSSDLVMRQYSRVKGERGKQFTYHDLQKVYIIVLYEKTSAEFHMKSGVFLHNGSVAFDTGLPLELLQKFHLVALDVFHGIPYDKREKNRLTGWLSLLTVVTPEEALVLVEDYPWLEEIFLEIAALRENPEEVLTMFSEALAQLDNNTMQYMIEEQQKVIEEKDAVISQKDAELSSKDALIAELTKRMKDAGVPIP